MTTNSKKYMAAWRAANKKKMNQYRKKWRDANQDHILAYERKYKKRPDRLKYAREYKKRPHVYRKLLARNAVYQAVKAGQIKPPKKCAHCRKPKAVQGHHHKGYDPRNWLNVVWLCYTCHRVADHVAHTRS